jgi:predicted phage terminase large subunit-like protein
VTAAAEIIRQTASPGLFAKTASRGRWRFARHLALLDDALCDAAARRKKRIIVQLPPRHGKSELVGRYFPAWYLGTFPDHNVIYASYEAGQARKYGRYARNVLAERGAQCFGLKVSDDSHAADRWNIQGREGGMVTSGVGGPLTGKGADILIVDDPVKNAEEAASEVRRDAIWDWWESTALTRLEPNGVAIIVQTRWHKDDLAGRAQSQQAGENWHVINLPALAEEGDMLGRQPGEALWPERYPRDVLEQIRDSRSLYWWLALYQQRPTKYASIEWPAEHFDRDGLWFDSWPADLPLKVITLDPSKGKTKHADYSAYILLARDPWGCYWIEADMDRRPVGKIVDDGVELCRRFRPQILGIEAEAWQDLLGPMFTPRLDALFQHGVDIHEIYSGGVAKENRIRRLDPHLRKGTIRFRNTPGTRILVQQLREFPMAAHDDGPDALEMAVRLAESLLTPQDVPEEYARA